MRRELFPAGRAAKTRRARRGQRPHPHAGNVIGLQCRSSLRDAPSSSPPARPRPSSLPASAHLENPLAASRRASRFSGQEPGCRRDGPQTPGLTDPKGRRGDMASRHEEETQQDPGSARRKPRRCWSRDACLKHTWWLRPVMMNADNTVTSTREGGHSTGHRGKRTVSCCHLVPVC